MKKSIIIENVFATECSICGKKIMNLSMKDGIICGECYKEKLQQNAGYVRLLEAILNVK